MYQLDMFLAHVFCCFQILSSKQWGTMDGFWEGCWPGYNYRNSWLNIYLSCSVLLSSPTLPSAFVLPSFLPSKRGFSFNFHLVKHSTLKFISLLRSLLFSSFQTKIVFWKHIFSVACWASGEVAYSNLQLKRFISSSPKVVRVHEKHQAKN